MPTFLLKPLTISWDMLDDTLESRGGGDGGEEGGELNNNVQEL